jgi:ATP-dependent DNA helicase RecQ
MTPFLNPSAPGVADIQNEATIVLQTVELLDQPYGIGYLSRILLGESRFELSAEAHAELPTFGALRGQPFDRVRNLLLRLLDRGLLRLHNASFGTLAVSPEGKDFLRKPGPLPVPARSLRTSAYDRVLLVELRQLRRSLSLEEGLPLYRVFTDYTLQLIVEQKPSEVAQLRELPGLGDYRINRYGAAILRAVAQAEERRKLESAQRLHKQAAQPAYREVKTLFEQGLAPEAIAQKRGIQPSTVRQMLSLLHEAGQVNLRPWIERALPSSDFEKGTEFFRRNPNPRLREAFESLGLDYNTLRLCRLYVSGFASSHEELPLAS